MVCKEEVVTWFRMLNGSQRIETLCALLDCCVSIEVRFIGSVIEDLVPRDFRELRDVDHKANGFVQPNQSLEANKLALYNALAAEPGQLVPTNHPGRATQFNPANNAYSGSHQNILFSSAFATSQDIRNNRPSPTYNPDGKHPGAWFYENQQLQSAQSKTSNSKPLSPLVNGSCMPFKGLINSSGNCIVKDENEEALRRGDLLVLSGDRTRQRMILYLALLTATNCEAASSFYALMSQVEQTVGAPGWLEGLEEIVLEEVALLYTLGTHHPAFTFEQRIVLSEILSQVQSQLYKHSVSRSYPYYQTLPQYEAKYSPQGRYYVQHVSTQQAMSQVQPQLTTSSTSTQTPSPQQLTQASAGDGVVSLPQKMDTSRLSPKPQHTRVCHPVSYPAAVYMDAQHPQAQHHPQIVANPVPPRQNVVPGTPMTPRTNANRPTENRKPEIPARINQNWNKSRPRVSSNDRPTSNHGGSGSNIPLGNTATTSENRPRINQSSNENRTSVNPGSNQSRPKVNQNSNENRSAVNLGNTETRSKANNSPGENRPNGNPGSNGNRPKANHQVNLNRRGGNPGSVSRTKVNPSSVVVGTRSEPGNSNIASNKSRTWTSKRSKAVQYAPHPRITIETEEPTSENVLPISVDDARRLRLKRDEERENLLGIQSDAPYYDKQYCYEDALNNEENTDPLEHFRAVAAVASSTMIFNPAAADSAIPLPLPVNLNPEAIQEARRIRRKRDEEREDLLGIQSEPYRDREYFYPYE